MNLRLNDPPGHRRGGFFVPDQRLTSTDPHPFGSFRLAGAYAVLPGALSG